ncbi:MAG: hypothetical protein EBU84_15180, partial [Actinobacteria bacterium]|nr:hypothetical protein [Actinomycetota bacterium]
MYEGYSLLEVLKRTEIRHIKAALKQSHGVKALAAKKLGIKRTTLIEKLRRHGLVLFAEKVYANRPAVCKNGHSLDEAYQYKLASRGGRVRRICKACTKA